MSPRSILPLLLAAACAGPPNVASPPAPAEPPGPSPACARAAELRLASAATTQEGRLRAALQSRLDAERLCAAPATWGELAELYASLGREGDLATLAERARAQPELSQAVRERVDAALARARAEGHGEQEAERLLARVPPGPGGPAARAMLERARDEIERAAALKVERFTPRGPASYATFSAKGRWISLGDEVLVSTETLRAQVLDGEPSFDPSEDWMATQKAPASRPGAFELWRLGETAPRISGRVVSEAPLFGGGRFVVWVERGSQIHVFDRTSGAESTLDAGAPLLPGDFSHPFANSAPGGSVRFDPRGRALLWVTETAQGHVVHARDLQTGIERTAAQPGRKVRDVAVAADLGGLATAWDDDSLRVIRWDDGRTLLDARGIGATALDVDVRRQLVAFAEGQKVGTVDLKTGRRTVLAGLAAKTAARPLAACGGGAIDAVVLSAADELTAACSSGDVGATLRVDLRTGAIAVVSAFSPGDDEARSRALAVICTRARAECCDDGCRKAVEAGDTLLLRFADGVARVAPSGRREVTLQRSSGLPLDRFSASEDGARAAAIADDGSLSLWNARTGTLDQLPSVHRWCRLGARLFRGDLCDD